MACGVEGLASGAGFTDELVVFGAAGAAVCRDAAAGCRWGRVMNHDLAQT